MTGLITLLQAAAQTAAATVQITASQPTDNIVATGGLAVVVAVVLQAMKNSKYFPFITRATSQINFVVGILAAGLATAGVHITYDAATGGTIALPSLIGLWQWVVQWAVQQAAYKGVIVPAETLGEIRTMMERYATPPPVSPGAAKAGEGTEVKP